MAFTPRLEQPDSKNANFIHTSYGGKNQCMLRGGGSVLPNCVGYAWGRFMEILGKTPTLSCQNAEDWYGYTQDGYERGSTPRLGAVICWSKGRVGDGNDGAGHVGIVEQINEDGTIVTSESSYSTYYFRTKTRSNSSGNWAGGDYTFQGFIYNPAVSSNVVLDATSEDVEYFDTSEKIAQFTDAAKAKVGYDGDWAWNNSSVSIGKHWAAAFIVACAKEAGILDIGIPKTISISSIPRIGSAKSMGEWHEGPYFGNNYTPSEGDIVFFRYSEGPYFDNFACDHAGIVVSVSSSYIEVIEGDVGSDDPYSSKVAKKSYNLSTNTISGYYSPKWGLVVYDSWVHKSLYESKSTERDAIVRELGYFTSSGEPSISPSNIRLSVINYTSPLSALFDNLYMEKVEGVGLPPSLEVEVSFNLDRLGSSQRTTVEYLMEQGLNCAAAIGIAANIDHESGFKTSAVGDNGTSFGICQWHASRGASMKKMVGSNWANNLTGQLGYLWYELEHGFINLLEEIREVPNSLSGAKDAADLFVRVFEAPANVDNQSKLRQATAELLWNRVVQQLT